MKTESYTKRTQTLHQRTIFKCLLGKEGTKLSTIIHNSNTEFLIYCVTFGRMNANVTKPNIEILY